MISLLIIGIRASSSKWTPTAVYGVYTISNSLYEDYSPFGCVYLSATGSTVHVSAVTLTQCWNPSGDGGGMYLYGTGVASFERSCFSECGAITEGQTVYVRMRDNTSALLSGYDLLCSNCGY